ncbi:MAG: hypothetical protein ACRDNG_12450 [Gaiellaceae bacterium]
MRRLALFALLALALLVPPACGGDEEPSVTSPTGTGAAEETAPSLPQGSEPANLDAVNFVAVIDNVYWPMTPGSRWVYRETDAEGSKQRVEVTVTDETKTIIGIVATVVHDVVSEDGEVVEDTYDWYAQDKWGNVWYLGEDTKEFDEGKVSTEGSWEAGVDGAEAGVVVPGSPEVGLAYRQEYYEGEAEDAGEILSLDERVKVPFGTYAGVLMTKDWTPLEPDLLEQKFYAKGIGPVLAIAVSGGSDREELIGFEPGG